jgi:hypothetical protein
VARRFLRNLDRGQINESLLRNAEDGFLESACKTALNVVLRSGGTGAIRRPGSNLLANPVGASRRYTYEGRGFKEHLDFYNGGVKIYASDGTLNQTITASVPWDGDDLDNLSFDADANRVFVACTTFMTQELTRDSGGTWTLADFVFADTVNGKTAQPFYDKFNDIDVTMTIGAYSGTGVAITFSDDVLVAGHVGKRFRYLTRCEVEIASVTNGTTGTVDIVDSLYPTLTVTVGSTAGYKVGQVVQGTVSDVTGIVTAIASGTMLRVLLLEGYEYFVYDGGDPAATDTLVSPEAAQKLTASATLYGTPATTSIWDEQLFSSVRGYPGEVCVHKNRLGFAAFPEATDVVVISALGNFYNFETGAEDEDAINEELGADPNSQIRHLVSTEQLLVFTDRGVYFVPEAPESPLTPTNIEFAWVSPDGASTVDPVQVSEGILFIDDAAGRLMVIAMTGNVRRPWQVVELSELSYDLLTGPKRLAVANGLDGRSERYVAILNTDGTIACMMYRRGSEVVGFSRWTHGEGIFTDVTASRDELFLTSKVSSTYFFSKASFSATCDDEQSYAAAVTALNGLTAYVVEERAVTGFGTVASGEIADVAAASGLTIGFDFDVTLEPAPPISKYRGFARSRIPIIWVDCIDSGPIYIGDTEYTQFLPTDPLDDPGYYRSRTIRAHQLGWSEEPTRPIGQTKGRGHRFDVRSVTMEVTQ